MPAFTLPAPVGALAALAGGKLLGDPAVPGAPVSLQLPAQSHQVDLTTPTDPTSRLGSFAISADAAASVALIRQATDPDPAGYFNLAGGAATAADNAPSLQPPVPFDPTLAYVVVSAVKVSGQLTGRLAIGAAGTLALDGSGSLDASACMAFPRDTPAWAAVSTAVSQFKTIFSGSELAALTPVGSGLPAPWQVLSFGVQGQVNLALKLTASSLAGQAADAVNAVLNGSGPFRFDASAAATLAVTFGASDGFRLFAHRAAPGAVTFSLKKASSTSLGLTANLGLQVAVSDTDLDNFVNSVFEQAGGAAAGTVQALLASPAAGPLSAAQLQTVQALLAKFGAGNVVGRELAALQAKLAALRADLLGRISPVVAAQFTYSWQRLTSASLVARFTVPDAVLGAALPDILALNLDALLGRAAADGIVFATVLGETVRTLNVGYGFSFGLDGYTFFKSWDSLQTRFVELTSLAPAGGWLRRESFLGKRAYTSSWLDSTQCNYVELDAAMSAPSAAPALGDFHPALSLAFSWKNVPFAKILPVATDFGVVVGAFPTDDVLAARQALVDAGLDSGATGDVLVNLTVGSTTLRQLLPVLNGPEYRTQLAPNAMARALPFTAGFPERSDAGRRMQVYGAVFAGFLATEEIAADTIARLCQDELPRVTTGGGVSPSLINGETNAPVLAWTAQGTVTMADASSLQDAIVTQLPACFADLARTNGDFRQLFPDCVSNFSPLAAQSYGTRIFASLLLLAARITPQLQEQPTRTVQFTWADGATSRTVVARQGGT
jgi:hypothetical protein